MTAAARAVRVCGVGHVALDMVFEVERIPQEPVKVPARALRRVVGGMTANACVAAARLGATVCFGSVLNSAFQCGFTLQNVSK